MKASRADTFYLKKKCVTDHIVPAPWDVSSIPPGASFIILDKPKSVSFTSLEKGNSEANKFFWIKHTLYGREYLLASDHNGLSFSFVYWGIEGHYICGIFKYSSMLKKISNLNTCMMILRASLSDRTVRFFRSKSKSPPSQYSKTVTKLLFDMPKTYEFRESTRFLSS